MHCCFLFKRLILTSNMEFTNGYKTFFLRYKLAIASDHTGHVRNNIKQGQYLVITSSSK